MKKKKTAILLVGALALTAVLSGHGKKTKRQQRPPMKVWSPKIRREKPKTAMMRRKKKKKKKKNCNCR